MKELFRDQDRSKDFQFSLVAQSCPTLCDPMDCSMPGFPVHHQLPCGSAGKESACNAGDLGLIPWRRERLPTPVFWPGEFHGLYSPWGCKESDTTEQLALALMLTF